MTSIGSSAFNNCSNLTNAKVPVTNFTEFCNNKVIGLISSYIEKPVTLIDKDGNEIKEYVIPEDVTGIGEKAFYNCSGLTSVTIPNSVTSIGNSAFYGCSGLTSVIIPSNVNSIGNGAFSSCTKLANVTLNSNSIVSAKRTSSTSFKSIFGEQVTNYVLGENVTSIGDYAFYSCSGLTSFIIPNSVTNIGISAFRYCSGLTSVTISSNVTSIGSSAFNNCSNLTNVKVPVTNFTEFCNNKVIGLISSYGKPVTLINKDGNEIKEYVIPEDVTTIGEKAFYNCSGITSVTIPSSVTSIGNSAFSGCSGLTSVIIPINVTSIGNGAFSSCTKLANVTLNSNSIVSAKRTSSTSFKSIFGDQVTNYILGDNVTAIGERAFYNCSGLTSVTIPNSVTSIDYSAFSECDQLSSVTLGDDITSIASSAFPSKTKFYTKHKTKTLFSLWNGSYKKIYEQETSKSLAPPSLDLKTSTQTSVTLEIINMYSEYTYEHSGKKVTSNTIEVNNLCPEYSTSYSVNVKYNDLSYTCSGSFTTKSISPKVTASNLTASSATIKGSYTEGDASVTSEKLIINNVEYDGNEKFVKGLNPNTTYTIRYVIEVTYGTGQKQTYNTTYRSGYSTLDRNFKTEALTLKTKQPKVVSLGNVIVSAEANVDDEEKNVGFEWRRTDWTDDFQSNTGTAIMVEGTMEGYIRNLNTEKLWKFRPYYLADNGTYYYGDWVGVDPTNTSFFEPTVHTYDKIVVNGNTALVKGYALGGSDDVTVQGFKYWKSAGGSSNRVSSADIPSDAKTVEASGTVMEVSLSDLDYDSSYSYVTFVTTSKGTYYGEIKTFETGKEPLILGDANGDMKVNVSDIVEIVNDILGKPSAKYNRNAADVNGDGQVNVTDIVNVVNIIMTSGSSASARRAASNNSLWLDGGTIRLRNAENYTATQFDINLSEGQSVGDISLSSTSNHQLTWQMVDENTCRVVVYSLSNTPFHTTDDVLFNITLNGSATISNEMLIDADGSATAVERIQQDKPMDVYDLRGNKVRSNVTNLRGLAKGIYIINGKKVIHNKY